MGELISYKCITWRNGLSFDRDALKNLKEEYELQGCIYAPFNISDTYVNDFISSTKELEYTVQGKRKITADKFALPNSVSAAVGIQYLHKINSESEIKYPPRVSNLLFDMACYLMGQERLVLCSDQFWYSFGVENIIKDHDAAQAWHFDLDVLEWVKIFTFFSKVEDDSGTHVAILGSHESNAKPLEILSYGLSRIPQKVTDRNSTNIYIFKCNPGSIIFGNTKCMHLGRTLSYGKSRLMHQFYLTLPLGSFYWPSFCSVSFNEAKYKT